MTPIQGRAVQDEGGRSPSDLAVKLRQIVEHSSNLFYSYTPDHLLTYLSPQTRQFLDCEPEEAMVRWTEFATDNPVNAKGVELTERAIRTGKQQPKYELELVGRKGRKLWVEVNEAPIVEAGKVVAVVGALTDVTERRRAAERLEASEAKLAEAQRLAHLGNWDWDIAEDKVTWSDELYRLFGLAPGSVPLNYDAYVSRVHPEDRTRVEGIIRKAFETRQPFEMDHRVPLPVGGERWLHCRGEVLLDDAGRPQRMVGTAQDVTERKLQEESLRTALSQLVGTLESTNDGILVVDPGGRITRYNRRTRELWGITDDLVSSDDEHAVLKFVLAQVKNAAWFLERIRDLAANTAGEGYDWVELVDGRVFEWHSVPQRIDNKIVGRVWSFRDATERRHAEQAVRRSEERFRTLSENAAIGIYRTTPDGRCLYANPALFRMLGCSSMEELAAMDLRTLYPAEPRARFLELIERDGSVRGLEFALQRRDDSVIHVRENARVVRGPEGSVQYYEGALEDVTQRKAAEEALRESEERFRSLFENATIGLYRTTPDGRVLMANPTLLRLLGYQSFEELAARDLETDFEPSYERRTFRERIERDGLIVGLESRWTRRDGSVIYVRESARAVREEGGAIKYYEGTVEDVTDRIRVEEELRRLNEELEQRVKRRTAQLEVANKELEAFSYSVSHDLRAPLRSIDGFSQEIMEDYGGQLDEGAKQLLHRVRSASQRMSQLIDDLLKLARVTRAEMQRDEVDLSGIARTIAEDLRQREPGRQVDVVIQPGLKVEGDARLLQIALENLLGNSWKFTSKHSRARIEFGGRHENGRVAFFVRDDGAGFEPGYAGKLFRSFQRLHSTREFEGTGIGLATVRQIVERHAGKIWAEGAVEKGATFYFTL